MLTCFKCYFRLASILVALVWCGAIHAAFSEKETHFLKRSDRSQITFYIKRPTVSAPILLVLQGSQFESVFDHGISNLDIPSKYHSALLMIEKPGVTRGASDCNENYKRLNNLDARLADVITVLNYLQTEPWWNGQLFILGGSEGGALAVKLTKALNVQRAVLLVTGGGMTLAQAMPTIMRESMRDAPRDVVEREIARLPAIFAEIKKHPDSTDAFFGECNTFKYWNSILWFRPVDTMLETQTTYLLVHGDQDTSHPVESARITARLFEEHAPRRLIYWEKPGLDHALIDLNGVSHMQKLLNDALDWLFATSRTCSQTHLLQKCNR